MIREESVPCRRRKSCGRSPQTRVGKSPGARQAWRRSRGRRRRRFAELRPGFRRAYGAFCVTNFWELLSAEREGAQATAMARATRNARFPDRVSFIADTSNASGAFRCQSRRTLGALFSPNWKGFGKLPGAARCLSEVIRGIPKTDT